MRSQPLIAGHSAVRDAARAAARTARVERHEVVYALRERVDALRASQAALVEACEAMSAGLEASSGSATAPLIVPLLAAQSGMSDAALESALVGRLRQLHVARDRLAAASVNKDLAAALEPSGGLPMGAPPQRAASFRMPARKRRSSLLAVAESQGGQHARLRDTKFKMRFARQIDRIEENVLEVEEALLLIRAQRALVCVAETEERISSLERMGRSAGALRDRGDELERLRVKVAAQQQTIVSLQSRGGLSAATPTAAPAAAPAAEFGTGRRATAPPLLLASESKVAAPALPTAAKPKHSGRGSVPPARPQRPAGAERWKPKVTSAPTSQEL